MTFEFKYNEEMDAYLIDHKSSGKFAMHVVFMELNKRYLIRSNRVIDVLQKLGVEIMDLCCKIGCDSRLMRLS